MTLFFKLSPEHLCPFTLATYLSIIADILAKVLHIGGNGHPSPAWKYYLVLKTLEEPQSLGETHFKASLRNKCQDLIHSLDSIQSEINDPDPDILTAGKARLTTFLSLLNEYPGTTLAPYLISDICRNGDVAVGSCLQSLERLKRTDELLDPSWSTNYVALIERISDPQVQALATDHLANLLIKSAAAKCQAVEDEQSLEKASCSLQVLYEWNLGGLRQSPALSDAYLRFRGAVVTAECMANRGCGVASQVGSWIRHLELACDERSVRFPSH